MTTLVVDTGEDIVGVFCVEEDCYTPYRGSNIAMAIQRIQASDRVITFNGEGYDLAKLGKFAGLSSELPLNGEHTDMMFICWKARRSIFFGRSLRYIYPRCFCLESLPSFPFMREGSEECDEYEGDNQRDVYMTYKLWELWKQAKL